MKLPRGTPWLLTVALAYGFFAALAFGLSPQEGLAAAARWPLSLVRRWFAPPVKGADDGIRY